MKKLMSLVLAVLMVVGISSAAFASSAAGTKITKAVRPLDTNSSWSDGRDVTPGEKFQFPLTADMFEWGGTIGTAGQPITKAQVSRAGLKTTISGNDTSVVKSVSIKYGSSPKTTGNDAAYVEVEFVKPFVSTSTQKFDFSVFLSLGTRQPDSRVRFQGEMINKVLKLSNTDYTVLKDDEVLEPTTSIRNLEIELANSNVILKVNVFSNQKYYGSASTDPIQADDAVLSKYGSITDVIRLNTINLKKAGNYVDLSAYSNRYFYDSTGKYLGTSNELLPYTTIYYVSSKNLGSSITTGNNTGGATGGGNNGGDNNNGGSGGNTGGGTGGSGGTGTVSGTVEKAEATTLMSSAVSAAKASGSATAIVTVKSKATVTADALKAANTTASNGGKKGLFQADTIVSGGVKGRLAINTANASKLTGNINLGVHISGSRVDSVKAMFNKGFKNKIVVISLDQKVNYGIPVDIAAKVDLNGLNKKNLYLYSYDGAANKYYRIASPNAWVDSNGYLRFSTALAGDIVVSDGALAKK